MAAIKRPDSTDLNIMIYLKGGCNTSCVEKSPDASVSARCSRLSEFNSFPCNATATAPLIACCEVNLEQTQPSYCC